MLSTTDRPTFDGPSERVVSDEYAAIVERLKVLYPTLHVRDIRLLVEDVTHQFTAARLTIFVPLLVEKIARDEWRRLSKPGAPA